MRIARRTLLASAPASLAIPRPGCAVERTKITIWHAMGSTPGAARAALDIAVARGNNVLRDFQRSAE